MVTVHKASSENVNYEYHQPKSDKKGSINGIMYQKVDKDTGKTKLINGSGFLGELLLKARGYTTATSDTVRKFFQAKFPNTGIDNNFDIHIFKKDRSATRQKVAYANDFQAKFTAQAQAAKTLAGLTNPVDSR
jgi:hypothetical protein